MINYGYIQSTNVAIDFRASGTVGNTFLSMLGRSLDGQVQYFEQKNEPTCK